MKKKLAVSLVTGIALASALGASPAVAVTVTMCMPTGFMRDGMNLTAAMIADGDVSGQTVDATGCNIGIYYGPGTSGTVAGSEVFGSNYFGIVATGEDGDVDQCLGHLGTTSVDVTSNNIHDIGEKPFNGVSTELGFITARSAMAQARPVRSPAMPSPSIKKAGSSRTGRMPRFRSVQIRSREGGRSLTSRRTGSRSAAAAPA